MMLLIIYNSNFYLDTVSKLQKYWNREIHSCWVTLYTERLRWEAIFYIKETTYVVLFLSIHYEVFNIFKPVLKLYVD